MSKRNGERARHNLRNRSAAKLRLKRRELLEKLKMPVKTVAKAATI